MNFLHLSKQKKKKKIDLLLYTYFISFFNLFFFFPVPLFFVAPKESKKLKNKAITHMFQWYCINVIPI